MAGNSAQAYVDPSAVVSPEARILPGCWIGPGVVVQAGCTIGPHAVVGCEAPDGPRGGAAIGAGAWVGPHVCIEPGASIAEECRIGPYSLIRGNAKIEKGAYVGPRCSIMDSALVREYANLIADVYVSEYTVCGAHCHISPGVCIVNDRYPPTALDVQGPVIGDCAVIGVQAVIWPGVKIGYHAMVAALAEVKQDVPDYVLVRGRPARPVCDVRQIRMKLQDKWVYPYPWMRLNMPQEDITRPAYDPRKARSRGH